MLRTLALVASIFITTSSCASLKDNMAADAITYPNQTLSAKTNITLRDDA